MDTYLDQIRGSSAIEVYSATEQVIESHPDYRLIEVIQSIQDWKWCYGDDGAGFDDFFEDGYLRPNKYIVKQYTASIPTLPIVFTSISPDTDCGCYLGQVVWIDKFYILQAYSTDIMRHNRYLFCGDIPTEGELINVSYKNGKMKFVRR